MNETDSIDLRSDTVTLPSAEMMAAIQTAPLGDDVYGGDPTVGRLERTMAETVGMQAGLFVTSGTQSNLTALMAHLGRGEEFLVGDRYHIFQHEACGSAVLGGLAPHPLAVGDDGRLEVSQVLAAIRPDDIHYPPTRLLCLENTFNGVPLDQAHQDALCDAAHGHGLAVHLDGARLFNAAVALGISARELCANVDSVSVCLSKGLGAPVGSVLCGTREFIERARRIRKMLGGGLRQAGILAACGLVALEQEVPRLAEDHRRAARLARALERLPGLQVRPESGLTNMVFVVPTEADRQRLRDHLAGRGIRTGSGGPPMRLVLHRDIDDAALERIVDAFETFYRG